MDFTLEIFRSLIKILQDTGYVFMSVGEWPGNEAIASDYKVILRHDVDKKPENALITAKLEYAAGIRGTYYFRIKEESYDERIIKDIGSMGHEIGYHYEDLDLVWRKERGGRPLKNCPVGNFREKTDCRGDLLSRKAKEKMDIGKVAGNKTEEELVAKAYESFRQNLAKVREIVHVDTICMHGSPLSRYDSRQMWKYYDYRELSVKTEPYLDISLDNTLYLTDTGRRWDGESVSIRDRTKVVDESYYSDWKRKPVTGSAMQMTHKGCDLQKQFVYRTTNEIIRAVSLNKIPANILMTIHPQRWSDRYSERIAEIVFQSIKNQVKYILKKYRIE
jgi:hypothetical protein